VRASPCCHPQAPRDRPSAARMPGLTGLTLVMRWVAIQAMAEWGGGGVGGNPAFPQTHNFPKQDAFTAHLSPKGSRIANLSSLPKTWLICGHRNQANSWRWLSAPSWPYSSSSQCPQHTWGLTWVPLLGKGRPRLGESH
jgi:hypothetical protein